MSPSSGGCRGPSSQPRGPLAAAAWHARLLGCGKVLSPPMRIDVVSDVICPWCYIGKRRLTSALRQRPEVEAQILWHPFQLNPDMPPEGMARERYIAAKFGGGQHASRIYQNVTEVGATVGIPFHFERIQVTPNTRDAHRLIRRATESGDAD